MRTFYKVVTRITDTKCTIKYAGEVKDEKRPRDICNVGSRMDYYEDYFDSKGEAQLFVRTQIKALKD